MIEKGASHITVENQIAIRAQVAQLARAVDALDLGP